MKDNSIRKIVREVVEAIFATESKKKKKSPYGMPVFSRGFFPYFGAGVGGEFGDIGMDFGGDIGGMEEGDDREVKTLSFFDFDGCLVNSPEPDDGKKRFKELTGEEYPYGGWWGRKESLDPFFDEIKPIQRTIAEYNKRKSEPNSKIILLTNRIQELSPSVEAILKKFNLSFDYYNYKTGETEKSDRIREYLEEYPTVNNINVYDDRDKEIEQFKQLKKELEPKGVYVNVFQVKK